MLGGKHAIQIDPLAAAYDCLANLSLHSKGLPNALRKAIIDAEIVIALESNDANDRHGWSYVAKNTEKTKRCGLAGALDAFGDGTCNPPNTPYMIQTGYVLGCLAQLYIVTKEEKYLEIATKVASDSWMLGHELSECKECFYYWYSYHPNDIGRYVRNTNLIMGFGIAWLYAATGDIKYRDRALAIGAAEHREIVAGNFGYFGIDDPKYKLNRKFEAERIENHVVHQVKALKDIGILLKNDQAIADSRVMLDAFLHCQNERCRPDNCKAWAAPLSCKTTATIAPCILADGGEPYQSRCDSVLKALNQLNAFQTFLRCSTSDPMAIIAR